MEFNLAQVNIGKLIAPIDSPVMRDFVANLDPINALAEKSTGFVWRLKDYGTSASVIKIFDDDFMIINMSVWKDLDVLFQYVYQSGHIEIFKRRGEWFEKLPEMHMALWYVPAGEMPTAQMAIERLMYLRSNGDTPYSFSFKKKFTVEEAVNFVH